MRRLTSDISPPAKLRLSTHARYAAVTSIQPTVVDLFYHFPTVVKNLLTMRIQSCIILALASTTAASAFLPASTVKAGVIVAGTKNGALPIAKK
jgi:hypothetical protein